MRVAGQELIDQTEAALQENPDLPLADQALIVAQGSFGLTFSGDFVGGELIARRALGLGERDGDAAMTVWSLTTMAVAVKTQGRYEAALALTGRAVQLASDSADDSARMRHPNFIHGMVLCDCDRMDDAALAFVTAAEESSAPTPARCWAGRRPTRPCSTNSNTVVTSTARRADPGPPTRDRIRVAGVHRHAIAPPCSRVGTTGRASSTTSRCTAS